MHTSVLLFWRDLRISDHPALAAAVSAGAVLPVFLTRCVDDIGSAKRSWLSRSLECLQTDLAGLGSPLLLVDDTPEHFAHQCHALGLPIYVTEYVDQYWHTCLDRLVEAKLYRYNPNLLLSDSAPRGTLVNKQGNPFKVFTPFWKTALSQASIAKPIGAPLSIQDSPELRQQLSARVSVIDALPKDWRPALGWDAGFYHSAEPGELGAQQALSSFLEEQVQHYEASRDMPAVSATSRLSPHLALGEIGIRTVLHRLLALGHHWDFANVWLRELGWREFCHYQLQHNPTMNDAPLNAKFEHFPWQNNLDLFKAWQAGQTGIPIVDAGMRQLWQTGWMHNRVRMIVGSLLVKNMLVSWQQGLEWFDDTLVDANPASNWASWQWIGGCGADAAPYFRIFNPVTQAEKFDPEAEYIKHWCPELKDLPNKLAHAPWLGGLSELRHGGVVLGKQYPKPVVDLKESRQQALAAFATLKAEH